MRALIFVLTCLFTQLAWADPCRVHLGDEYPIPPGAFGKFIICEALSKDLSKLGVQWNILAKAGWEMKLKTGAEGRFETAANPLDPWQTSYLLIDPNSLNSEVEFRRLIHDLQIRHFPRALRLLNQEGQNVTALGFESTVYHMTSMMDKPVTQYWNKKESARVHYFGTLFENKKFPDGWCPEVEKLHPILDRRTFQSCYHWEPLRDILESYEHCNTSCLERQERKVLSGLLATLENPVLVDRLHFTRLAGFGPHEGEFMGVQEILPRRFGCFGQHAFDSVFTGDLLYDYNWTGGQGFPDYTQYGAHGLLGKTIYIEALNKSKVDSEFVNADQAVNSIGVPAHFQGQNAIIREITDEAVLDLKMMGGLGASDIARSTNGFIELEGYDLEDFVATELTGASQMIADYQLKRRDGEDVSQHPIQTSAFFNQTVISKGHTLKAWVDLLHDLNPPVAYYIFAYDHGFKPRSGEPWKSYYDRILYFIEQELPEYHF